MMGLAKVGRRNGKRPTEAAVKKNISQKRSLFTSAFVFLSICLKGGEGHREEQAGGRANNHGFNVPLASVKLQPGRDAAFVQSCF